MSRPHVWPLWLGRRDASASWGAIAADKAALLPGRAATAANYTGSASGITGVMIDVARLPPGAVLTENDFTFRVGNDDAPSAWPAAPRPAQVAVRRGAGAGGADRVTLTWPAGAIVDAWLEVTVLANDRIGIPARDTFFFGDLAGDTGNAAPDAAEATVNAGDLRYVRSRLSGAAGVSSRADHNRHGRVNTLDVAITRQSLFHSLRLITPRAVVSPPAEVGGASVARRTAEAAPVPLAKTESAGFTVLAGAVTVSTSRRLWDDLQPPAAPSVLAERARP